MSASIYGAAFQACVYGGDTGRAIFLLKDASKRGMSVPPATVANTMRVVSKQESGWNHALSLYYAFLEHTVGQGQAGMVPNTGQGGVDSLGNAKDSYEGILRMRQRLQKISEAGPGLTIVCQAALESCVIGGQWERALEILGTLRAGGGGAQLSREAYGKAIEVCGRCCAWDTVGFVGRLYAINAGQLSFHFLCLLHDAGGSLDNSQAVICVFDYATREHSTYIFVMGRLATEP